MGTEPGQPPAKYYIGPAGWSYPDWKGIIYPRRVVTQKRCLDWVSRWFNLVEINTSFYHTPRMTSVENWVNTVRDRADFRFTVKLHQEFTHRDDLNVFPAGRVAPTRAVLDLIRDAGRLGAVLAQFPWSFRCERSPKIHLKRLLDAFEGYPLTVEIRHHGWDIPEYRQYLRQRQAAFCNIDQPLFEGSLGLTAHVTAPFAYLRLHGRNQQFWFDPGAGRDDRYNYLYNESEVRLFVKACREMAEDAQEVYVVTNNHYRGKAVFNALQIGRELVPGFAADIPLEFEGERVKG